MKLFFLPDARQDVESRRNFADEAMECVANALGVEDFDTLLLSLPRIILEKDEEDYSSKEFPIPEQTVKEWVNTWKVYDYCLCSNDEIMESLQRRGKVSTLGVSEFGVIRLKALLPHVKIRPVLDQINLRDCCEVPRDLLEFAKHNNIMLMPHMDQDNPVPKETLQDILDDLEVKESVTEMRWVVKYTAIVKERGVIQNKGYILPVFH